MASLFFQRFKTVGIVAGVIICFCVIAYAIFLMGGPGEWGKDRRIPNWLNWIILAVLILIGILAGFFAFKLNRN